MPAKLGEKLRARRKELGLSLDALAEKAKLSKSYLWELENRPEANPSADKLGMIADVLETSVSWLLEDAAEAFEDKHLKEAFFKDYEKLDTDGKKQLHDILKVIRKHSPKE